MISKRLTSMTSMALAVVLTISIIAYTPLTGAASATVTGELIDE